LDLRWRWPLPKLFDAMFFGLHFREPGLYFIVPIAILAVAMLATYIPARRATRRRSDGGAALRMKQPVFQRPLSNF